MYFMRYDARLHITIYTYKHLYAAVARAHCDQCFNSLLCFGILLTAGMAEEQCKCTTEKINTQTQTQTHWLVGSCKEVDDVETQFRYEKSPPGNQNGFVFLIEHKKCK